MSMDSQEITILCESFTRLDRGVLIECVLARVAEDRPDLVPASGEAMERLKELMGTEFLRFAANVHQMLNIAPNLVAMGAKLSVLPVSESEIEAFAGIWVQCVRDQLGDDWNESLEWIWGATTQAAMSLVLGGLASGRGDRAADAA